MPPLWITLSILAVFVLAAAEVAQKVLLTSKFKFSVLVNNFYVTTIGFALCLLTLPFEKTLVDLGSVSLWVWVGLTLVSITSVVACYFYYSNFADSSASITAIFGSFSVVITTALGILFFAESTSPYKFIGIFLILLAIVLVEYKPGEKIKKASLFALLGACLFGINYTFDKGLTLVFGAALYQTLLLFGFAVVTAAVSWKSIIAETKRSHISILPPLLLASVAYFATNRLFFWAYAAGAEVGKLDSVNNTVVFAIIFLEVLILKDREALVRKLVCGAIAFAGVYLLV